MARGGRSGEQGRKRRRERELTRRGDEAEAEPNRPGKFTDIFLKATNQGACRNPDGTLTLSHTRHSEGTTS